MFDFVFSNISPFFWHRLNLKLFAT